MDGSVRPLGTAAVPPLRDQLLRSLIERADEQSTHEVAMEEHLRDFLASSGGALPADRYDDEEEEEDSPTDQPWVAAPDGTWVAGDAVDWAEESVGEVLSVDPLTGKVRQLQVATQDPFFRSPSPPLLAESAFAHDGAANQFAQQPRRSKRSRPDGREGRRRSDTFEATHLSAPVPNLPELQRRVGQRVEELHERAEMDGVPSLAISDLAGAGYRRHGAVSHHRDAQLAHGRAAASRQQTQGQPGHAATAYTPEQEWEEW